MMRDLQECQAEVFRRSEQRLKERKKRRNHTLMLCIPLVLCLTAAGGFLLSGAEKSTDSVAPEMATGTFYATTCEVIAEGDGVFVRSVEVSGNGLSHMYTSVEDVQGIVDLIDGLKKAPVTNSTSESTDLIPDQIPSITVQEDFRLGAYKILIKHSDGTSTEYSLMGSTLTNQTTQETFHMTEDTYFALKDLLGIPLY